MSTPTNEPTARERFHAEQARVLAARVTRKTTDAAESACAPHTAPNRDGPVFEATKDDGGCQ